MCSYVVYVCEPCGIGKVSTSHHAAAAGTSLPLTCSQPEVIRNNASSANAFSAGHDGSRQVHPLCVCVGGGGGVCVCVRAVVGVLGFKGVD